jgi:hypothetical protein
MPKHNVYISLPSAELVNSDAVFSIYQNGRKLGTITIPKVPLNGIQATPNSPIR